VTDEMSFSLQLMLSPADALGKYRKAASSVPATTAKGGSVREVELALLFMTGYRSLIARWLDDDGDPFRGDRTL
jgi:hypothetical protein